jgi:hypothetical protein
MSRFSFTLRDLLWLTLVVAMGCTWWMRERQHALTEERYSRLMSEARERLLTVFRPDGHEAIDWPSRRPPQRIPPAGAQTNGKAMRSRLLPVGQP